MQNHAFSDESGSTWLIIFYPPETNTCTVSFRKLSPVVKMGWKAAEVDAKNYAFSNAYE